MHTFKDCVPIFKRLEHTESLNLNINLRSGVDIICNIKQKQTLPTGLYVITTY